MARLRVTFQAVLTALSLAAVVALLVWTNRLDPLLFHIVVEMFVVGVGLGVFLIVWNSRQFLHNNYLLLVGISLPFVMTLNLLHALAYKGMDVFQASGSNLATQLWVAERYLLAASMLAAPLVLGRRVRVGVVMVIYVAVTAALLASIFAWQVFPTCSVDVSEKRTELTTFKVVSEYVICGILAGGLALLWRKREAFNRWVLLMLVGSIAMGIAAEVAFTLYNSVFGRRNMIGHLLILGSYYLVYKALIETGLRHPYNLLFRELRRQEKALRESEERFRTMAEFTYDWEYWRSEDRRFLYVSPSCERITGYRVQEFLENPELLVEITHPEDREMIREHMDETRRVDTRHSIDFRIVRRDGSVRWLNHVCRTVVGADGRLLGVRASNRDITDRVEVERQREALLGQLDHERARLKTIIESAPEGIVVTDPDGRVVMTNPVADELYGQALPRDDSAEDLSTPEVRYLDGRPFTVTDLPHHFRSCDLRSRISQELVLVWPDGQRRDLLQNVAPICDDEGRLTGAVGILQDVTEQHQMRAELVRRATQLETLIREAHHRIRNNLQSVVALLEVERGRLDSSQTEPVERCIGRVQAIATVHRLLTAEATDDVSLQRLLKSLSELANATAIGTEHAAIEVVLAGPDISLSSKKATSVAIVVNELMANAIEHAFRGRKHGRISIEVSRDEGNGLVEVTVADNGEGFPESPSEGTGLALSRSIVEGDLGGRFVIEKGPQGSLCRLSFEA